MKEKQSFKKKLFYWRYIIAAVILILLFSIISAVILLRQKPKPDPASEETIRLRGSKEIPRFQPCKGWASVAVLYAFASLAFPKLGQGDGSDFGKHGGMLNFG